MDLLRFFKRLACGCLVLMLLAAAGVAFVVWDLSRPPARTASKAVAPPPPPVEDQRQAEATVKRLAKEVKAATPEGATSKRFALRLTAAEVNQMLRALPEVKQELKANRVEQTEVDFEEGQVVARARVQVGGLKARVSAIGAVRAENGKLAVETKGLYLGMLPAPPNVREELDRTLQESVARFNSKLKGRIDKVQVTPGALRLEGELNR